MFHSSSGFVLKSPPHSEDKVFPWGVLRRPETGKPVVQPFLLVGTTQGGLQRNSDGNVTGIIHQVLGDPSINNLICRVSTHLGMTPSELHFCKLFDH